MLSLQQQIFNKVAKTITENHVGSGHSVIDMFIDAFKTDDGEEYEFIVIKFIGGAISVRTCIANSLTVNLAEAAKLMNGGYYDEVDRYKELKKREVKN